MVRQLAESKENPWVDEMVASTVVTKDVDLVQKMVDLMDDLMVDWKVDEKVTWMAKHLAESKENP